MPQIKFTIEETGAVAIDAQGYTGTTCKDATKAYEAALGAAEADSNRATKPELHQRGPQTQTKQR